MKKNINRARYCWLILIWVVCVFSGISADTTTRFSRPLTFTENQGQWDSKVSFRTETGKTAIWFGQNDISYQLTRISNNFGARPNDPHAEYNRYHNLSNNLEFRIIKVSLVDANTDAEITGREQTSYKSNYFIGNDPNRWFTDVPSYRSIVYQNIYLGIDLKYYGNGKNVEYDFILAPSAYPSMIQLKYTGVKSLSIGETGDLLIQTDWNEIIEQKPFVYQIDNYQKHELEAAFTLSDNNIVGFKLLSEYNPNLPLIIDPIITYGTYLGGAGNDQGFGIAVDNQGCAYLTGWTLSSNYPTENPYDSILNGGDVFITKMSASGDSLIYSTYLGGTSGETGFGVTVDDSGRAYITGVTSSSDFPTQNAYDDSYTGFGNDIFITRLSSDGNSLSYSTYLGGEYADGGYDIAVDNGYCSYITGWSESSDFPTESGYQNDFGGGYNDAIVTKLSSAGNTLVFSTFLGGTFEETGKSVAVDGDGYVYIAGQTFSTDFPLEKPIAGSFAGYGSAIVTKLSTAGDALIFSTYLAGSTNEVGEGIAVDQNGCAYVTGTTESTDFPTENPYDSGFGGGTFDAYLTKFDYEGTSLAFSTYLGGMSDDYGNSVVVDDSGCAYIAGQTSSSDFPMENPYDNSLDGSNDIFVTKFSAAGDGLIYSTYIGGSDGDGASAIDIDTGYCVYLAGWTQSSDFPVEDAYDDSYNDGGADNFVVKLCNSCDCEPGNANGDETLNIFDITYIISYLYLDGPAPIPYELCSGDPNSDCVCNIFDITYIISNLYLDGPPPCTCEDWLTACGPPLRN